MEYPHVIKNLAIISGNSAKVKDGRIVYAPSQNKPEPSVPINNMGNNTDWVLLRSEEHFNSGELKFIFKCQSHEASVLTQFYSIDGKVIICGYSRLSRQFMISVADGDNSSKVLSGAGKLENYELDKEIHFRITVKGYQIDLFINNILLCSANISIKDSPIEFFIESDDACEIHDIVKRDSGLKPSAFVVMQFSREYDELYDEVIKPVTEYFGYQCVRADEKYASTPIRNDMIQSIKDSSVVVADITPNNPNVYYELGYSHAIGKPTILLCEKNRDTLPFDVSGLRTIFYANTIVGKREVEDRLKKYLEKIKMNN